MIDKTHRFQGHNSLRFVYQKGTTVRGPVSAVRYIRNHRRQTYRLAVVVSRKVHKSAVVRNRIRRRIYEIVRVHEVRITAPYDIVLTVFTDQLATMPAPELAKAVLFQLEKAGILSLNAASGGGRRAIVKQKES